MTQQTKSGERVEVDGIENLKPGEGLKISNDTKYEYGADLSTDGVRIEDKGQGDAVSIRVFEFKMNPSFRGEIDKQALFNAHARQLSTILWSDGLQPVEGASPRVTIDVKKGVYQIFIACEGRLGKVFADKPRNLSEELSKKRGSS